MPRQKQGSGAAPGEGLPGSGGSQRETRAMKRKAGEEQPAAAAGFGSEGDSAAEPGAEKRRTGGPAGAGAQAQGAGAKKRGRAAAGAPAKDAGPPAKRAELPRAAGMATPPAGDLGALRAKLAAQLETMRKQIDQAWQAQVGTAIGENVDRIRARAQDHAQSVQALLQQMHASVDQAQNQHQAVRKALQDTTAQLGKALDDQVGRSAMEGLQALAAKCSGDISAMKAKYGISA